MKLAHINALKPDLVLVSGDITHNGTLAEVSRAALPTQETAHCSYTQGFQNLRIIALDSCDPDAPNGPNLPRPRGVACGGTCGIAQAHGYIYASPTGEACCRRNR